MALFARRAKDAEGKPQMQQAAPEDGLRRDGKEHGVLPACPHHARLGHGVQVIGALVLLVR